MSAFLHDIGKARGGDHATVGADLAAAFLRRAGFGPATVAVVVDAVRHHLLLSQTATRRDIADPAIIDEIVTKVDELRQLQLLYLLTIADLRATGSTMWNQWRASLLRRLYRRVAKALETGEAVRATPDIEAIIDVAGSKLERRLIEEHVAAMPGDYLDTTSPRQVAWHLEVASRLDVPGQVSVDPRNPGRILVAGTDRAGFLLAVTQAFTVNGVGVMDARLRTRSDGIALDTFHVADDQTGATVAPDRWDRVAEDLVAALNGKRDLRPAIRERVRAYRRHGDARSLIEVRTDGTGRHTVIEVRAPDRVGLLMDIVEALHDEGLDVHLAKIDTMGGQARDLFHVRRVGAPIRSESELAALRSRIRDRLQN
ncbi:MAG: HD domain-containing protein [Actinomycetota bacterium]|nr:HD domain-containing protein [Actinomycetota bacterium]